VEASALPGSVGLARPRIGLGVSLLRLRSDEQLVSLFRSGNEEAFRVIHDRYRQRLHAYSRQMLAGSVTDAEDVVQEIFVRAYGGLRSSDRDLALRAWLYRIAHNRCIDEVRRPQPLVTEAIEELIATPGPDPMARVEQRDALRRLIADVRRLPEQQRSALLMRELGGMPYADVAEALAVSVPAVKSLLVRARVGLAQAGEARDTSCSRIREDLIVSHDRGVRTSGLARRHMRDCPQCRRFRSEVRGFSRQLAALLPALGPIGVVAKLLGVGSASSGSAAAGTGAAASTGAAAGGTGAVISVGAVTAGAGHVVTVIAAAVVTAGGAIELQRISPPVAHHVHHHLVRSSPAPSKPRSPLAGVLGPANAAAAVASVNSGTAPAPPANASGAAIPHRPQLAASTVSSSSNTGNPASASVPRHPLPISEVIDPDNLNSDPAAGNPTATTTPSTTTPGTLPTTGVPATGTPTTSGPTTPTGTTTTGTGTPSTTGTGTVPTSTTPPTGTTQGSGTGQPSTGLAPLTQTSKTSGTGSGSRGGVALGATGSSTRPGSVRVYKSIRR
jgi:RNA polymerase sigma factor (sigma-70 family)